MRNSQKSTRRTRHSQPWKPSTVHRSVKELPTANVGQNCHPSKRRKPYRWPPCMKKRPKLLKRSCFVGPVVVKSGVPGPFSLSLNGPVRRSEKFCSQTVTNCALAANSCVETENAEKQSRSRAFGVPERRRRKPCVTIKFHGH